VLSYLRRAFSIYPFLSPYFSRNEEIDQFRLVQKATGALIAGPAALAFFDRLAFDAENSFLEVFVQYSFALVVADFLQSIGYQFSSTGQSTSPRAQENPDSAIGISSIPFAVILKRDYHATLGLINQSYSFVKQVESFDMTTPPQKRKIQLRTSIQIPLEVILDRSQSSEYFSC